MTLCDFISLKDYWYATVSAVIGCAGGIAWANRQLARAQKKKDQEARAALAEALTKMAKLAGDAATAFRGSSHPSFPIENQRAGVLTERISEFRDKDLRGQIEGVVYECSHYNAKLAVVNSAYMLSLVNGGHGGVLTPYRTMMAEHLEKIVSWADAALENLKKEDANSETPKPTTMAH